MKVLASDFDGTLYFLNEGTGFKKNDIKAIKEFQEKGHLFGLCTGRSITGVLRELKGYIDCDFFIVSSGACILNKDFDVIYERYISRDIIEELYNIYKDQSNVFIQAKSDVYTFDSNPKTLERKRLIKSFDEIGNDHIYSLSFDASNEDDALKVCSTINKKYDKKVTAFSNNRFLDIVSYACSKGKGIEKLKQILNINCIAGIGDSYNDIPMLQTVDKSFTFHDSPTPVKEKADYIVESIEEAISYL